MSTLEVTLFGTLSVQVGGTPLAQLPSGKIKHLLAYLLLNRHTVHPREQLAGLFWGDEGDQRARHCPTTPPSPRCRLVPTRRRPTSAAR